MYCKLESRIIEIIFLVIFGSFFCAAVEKITILFQVKNSFEGSIRYQLNRESSIRRTNHLKNNIKIVFYTKDRKHNTKYLQQQDNKGLWPLSTRLNWDKAGASWGMDQELKVAAFIVKEYDSLFFKENKLEQWIEIDRNFLSENSANSHNPEQYLSICGESFLSIPLTESKRTYYTIGYGTDLILSWYANKHVFNSTEFFKLGFHKNLVEEVINETRLSLFLYNR